MRERKKRKIVAMRRARTKKLINKGLQRKLIAVFVGIATYCSLFLVDLLNRSLVQVADRVDAGPEFLDVALTGEMRAARGRIVTGGEERQLAGAPQRRQGSQGWVEG